MALEGTIRDFGLPDIFQLIGLQRKTGHLTLANEKDDESVTVTFENGMVFTLDMPYHEVGWGTTHVEDMMVVRAGGAVPLSSGNISLRRRPG